MVGGEGGREGWPMAGLDMVVQWDGAWSCCGLAGMVHIPAMMAMMGLKWRSGAWTGPSGGPEKKSGATPD